MQILLILLFIPVTIIIRGLILTQLWGWFIANTFNLPNLTVPIAIGISLVITYLTYQSDARKDKNDDEKTVSQLFTNQICCGIIAPLFYLLFGWIVTLFM